MGSSTPRLSSPTSPKSPQQAIRAPDASSSGTAGAVSRGSETITQHGGPLVGLRPSRLRSGSSDAEPASAMAPRGHALGLTQLPGPQPETDGPPEGASCLHASDRPNTQMPSSLPLSQQQLVGVARWPDPKYNTEASPHQTGYGLKFAQHCVDLGGQIRSGDIPDLQTLWRSCREWRLNEAANQPEGVREKFGLARNPGNADTGTLKTPIGAQYAYIHRRVLDSAIESRTDRKPGVALSTLQHATTGVMGTPRYVANFQCEVDAGGKKIPLTLMSIVATKNRSPVNVDVCKPGIVGCMTHTQPEHIGALMNRAQQVFRSVLDDAASLSADQKMRRLAELHWLLTQAAPDARGSAAKSEMTVRAVACSLDMELPPFKSGAIPDLEAFVTPLNAFVDGYQTLFSPNRTV